MEKVLLLILALFFTNVMADFSTDCPPQCKCLWELGNKKADCSQSQLQDIPETLDSDIQILDLNGNNLTEIPREAFVRTGLINLKKLFLNDCKLTAIHKNGLSSLEIMIMIDLSNNKLKTLHAETFRETTKIMWILLNDNQLEKLEDGLFNNLSALRKVELSNNKIFHLGTTTFLNVPHLDTLKLNGNRLQNIHIDALSALTSIATLILRDNPWRCDCHLKPFRDWVIENNLNTTQLSCSEPSKVRGKLWTKLEPSDYEPSCESIVYASNITNLPTSHSNINNISCQINGNPLPEVNWVLNPHVIEGTYKYQGDLKYNITQNSMGVKLVKVTIIVDVSNIKDKN